MNLTQMICASVPIMESDENVAKLLSDYVDDVYNSMLRDESVGVTGVVGNGATSTLTMYNGTATGSMSSGNQMHLGLTYITT